MISLIPLIGILVIGVLLAYRQTGRNITLLIFILALPFYTIFLSLVYKLTGNYPLIMGVKLWKELIPLILLSIIMLVRWKQLIRMRLTLLDVLVLLFLSLNILYLFIPNNVELMNKFISFKNHSFFCIIYFLGRVIKISKHRQKNIVRLIIGVGVFAGIVAILEYFHFINVPDLAGLMNYTNSAFNQQTTGEYGLTWTFQTAFGARRYSSFFANPLELASSCILTGSAALFMIYGADITLMQRVKYKLLFLLIISGLILSVSRASTISVVLVSILILLYHKKYISLLVLSGLIIISFILLLGNLDFNQYFKNTVNFSNPSSLGHLIEWSEGGQSIISNPLGLGFGRSGPSAARFGDDQIGGESQFIITGVELGVLGLLLYILILSLSILNGFRGYKYIGGTAGGLCLISSLSRIGLVIPSMTSAINTYIFIMFVSWWLVGFSVQQLQIKDLKVL